MTVLFAGTLSREGPNITPGPLSKKSSSTDWPAWCWARWPLAMWLRTPLVLPSR